MYDNQAASSGMQAPAKSIVSPDVHSLNEMLMGCLNELGELRETLERKAEALFGNQPEAPIAGALSGDVEVTTQYALLRSLQFEVHRLRNQVNRF